jgi:uncharacterized repeat protein (TIGR03803 family)
MNLTQPANRVIDASSLNLATGLTLAGLLTFLFLSASAAPGQTFSLLHQFRSGPGGINPYAGVVLDAKGNLYGTTYNDGAFAFGTVFKISAAGQEKVLHSFRQTGGDGAFPWYGTLVRDSSGNLYGTSGEGGIYGQCCGTVFRVSASGKETVLFSFTRTGENGYFPQAGVVRDSSGNLYGMSESGGSGGAGLVFRLDATGKESVLYSFIGSSDGANPQAGLMLDAKGNLYGTAFSGGSSFAGVVFRLDPTGKEVVLYNFTGSSDGGYPESGLIRDSRGNLYGTTYAGGNHGAGTVFKVDAQGKETVLYSFTGGTDGGFPMEASLVRDSAGNLYGTTPQGGSSSFGVVFKIDTAGNQTVLHNFSGRDGKIPYGTLALDKSGNLYGTTYEGGAYGGGVVFKIAP